ncbi:NAD-dependent epimerase/dehydratase family protein [Brachyspira catarrhinii]|uniref:NAD(P)-dependent oxidoreductase n=1 Tax=Brachyspira catarrhinii TaxID=2528966 RepID=A0ABY2TNV6_9SPIR|nr:NAD(P)-dependent oxidoreductase [Brachyspira catarrhinii]TKZ30920.1 NAD(P)-dependent oxidoreductase [Brachyspira catarrhinii]
MINSIILEDVQFVFNQLKILTDLSKLDNSSILITGGTGLFGKSILNFLLYARKYYNFDITILTRNKYNFLFNYPQYSTDFIHFINGDIRDFNCDKEYDYIIHAATPASENLEKENPSEMYSIILDGTKNIINIASRMSVKKLLFTSSGAVYGEQYEAIKSFKETYYGYPITYYGKAKKISEELFLESGINVSIARCFAFVGPYLNLDIHFAVGNFIRDVIHNKNIIIRGDGRPLRSYLYTADLVIWLFVMLLNSNDKSIYNVGSSYEVSIYDLAKKVSNSINNYYGNIEVLTKPNYSYPTPKYIPNNSKIIEELKVKENYTLDVSIKRTIEWNLSVGVKNE